MTLFSATDALSQHVLCVGAEECPRDVWSGVGITRAMHTVVFKDETFLGVVLLREIAFSNPDRTFADLIPAAKTAEVAPTATLDIVGQQLEQSGTESVVVLGDGGGYVGLVTRESLLDALLRQTAAMARRERRHAEHRFQQLLEAAPDAMLIFDRQGRILQANAHCASLFGYTSDELVGAEVARLIPESMGDAWIMHDPSSLADREAPATPSAVRELCGRRKDGAALPLEVSFSPPMIGPRAPVIIALRDISDRKQAEQVQRETNERLQQALEDLRLSQAQIIRQERLRALGQMASGVAHDLNNALSPVLGYAEMLLHDPHLEKKTREWASWIYLGAKDAAGTVEQLQHFYRGESIGAQRKPVNLYDLASRMPDLTRPRWRDQAQQHGQTIHFDLDLAVVPEVLGVETELRQMLINLVFNAIEAMPDGGRITLRLRTVSGEVAVEISDTGVGMNEDQRQRCIEPFFSTKTNGSGLGLSVCHGIVRRHNGRIEIDSQPRQGTTVRVILPPLVASADDWPASTTDDDHLPQYRVLYIDDDLRLRKIVRSLLEQLGQVVDVAENGAAGLAQFESGSYDVVMTDLGMSGVDGRQVTKRVRQICPEIPVVMLTGWSANDVFRESDPKDLPTHFVEKPPTLAKLRAALQIVAQILDKFETELFED